MFSVMSLQRIFSSTTIIVGLFISVDYGLCDEFRCRGREVSSHTTAAMRGTWGVRAIWTFIYVGALAAFAMFFTMLEQHYTTGVILPSIFSQIEIRLQYLEFLYMRVENFY